MANINNPRLLVGTIMILITKTSTVHYIIGIHVQSGKLCPTGWHVPTDDDWTTLSDYLGGPHVAGGKLKEAGTVHWKDPNTVQLMIMALQLYLVAIVILLLVNLVAIFTILRTWVFGGPLLKHQQQMPLFESWVGIIPP